MQTQWKTWKIFLGLVVKGAHCMDLCVRDVDSISDCSLTNKAKKFINSTSDEGLEICEGIFGSRQESKGIW